MFRPQSKSWLARGAFILIAYSALCGVFWLGALTGYSSVTSVLLWPTLMVGFLAAVYTAFLFGQCEGRDLWQTSLLPIHLIVQALLCGAAVLACVSAFPGVDISAAQAFTAQGLAREVLAFCLGLHLLMVGGEVAMPHATDNAQYAVRLMTRGPFSFAFWMGAIVVGILIPLGLLLVAPYGAGNTGIASILALFGLLIFEWCFVMAGQSVPNS